MPDATTESNMSTQEHFEGNGKSKRIGKSKKYPADDFVDDGVVHGNGVNPETMQEYVSRIQNLYADIAVKKQAVSDECKIIQTDIKQVYIEAKKQGLNEKALKAVIKELVLLAKAAAVTETLSGDEADMFEMMKDALGDFGNTALGQAALSKVS